MASPKIHSLVLLLNILLFSTPTWATKHEVSKPQTTATHKTTIEKKQKATKDASKSTEDKKTAKKSDDDEGWGDDADDDLLDEADETAEKKGPPADYGHMYVAIFGGEINLRNNVNNPHRMFPLLTRARYHSGYHGGVVMGYQSSSHFRYETVYTYLQGSTKNVLVNQALAVANGKANAHAILFNIICDFKRWSDRIFPYVGLGAGWARMEIILKDAFLGTKNGMPVRYLRIVDNEFAYQGMGGIGIQVGKHIAFDVGYRYFSTFTADRPGKRFHTHIASAGVAYHFA